MEVMPEPGDVVHYEQPNAACYPSGRVVVIATRGGLPIAIADVRSVYGGANFACNIGWLKPVCVVDRLTDLAPIDG